MPHGIPTGVDRRRLVAMGGAFGLFASAASRGGSATTEHYGEPIRLSQVGAGARTFADETEKVQGAIDLAVATERPLLIDVATRVSTLHVRKANGLFVIQAAPIVGMPQGDYSSLLSIEDSSDITWAGRLWLSCQWNPGYECAIRFVTRNARITSNITVQDWSITGARTAFQFGDPDPGNGAISEITIMGGFSYGCPNVVKAFGTETVISFVGANLVANHLGGDARWSGIGSDALRIFGATVSIMGGEVQHNASAIGSAFLMQPYVTGRGPAQFGSVVAMGVAIEAAGPLLTARDLPGREVDRHSGNFYIEGCHGYHSQTAIPFIDLGEQYGGRVKLGGGCYFRAGARRTVPIVKRRGTARIDVPDEAFNVEFQPQRAP